jgi:hypothetical protein
VPVNTPNVIAGSIQSGLTTSVRGATNSGSLSLPNNLLQCNSTGSTVPGNPLTFLRYSENFGSAFKLRTGSGQGTTTQNVPGTIYNSESGFIPYNGGPLITGLNYGTQVGLADYATRLKAVFNGLPANTRIFVSTTNVINGTMLPAIAGSTSYAQLVISDTAIDASGIPGVPITGLMGTIPYAEIIPSNGTASATWEVVNTNPALNENFDFGVWILYSANPAANSPAPGTTTINMSFAPTPSSGAFTATSGALASSQFTVPRFADTSTAGNIFTVVPCTTTLMFPFVTNQAGFDTGLAIVNTTSDPFGTKPQSGTCALNFFGQNAPPVFTTPSIPSGNNIAAAGNWAFMASTIAPNFEGYMIAVCQFQLAHGYAFVTDLGAQKLAEGYLALIVSTGTGKRDGLNPEQLEN